MGTIKKKHVAGRAVSVKTNKSKINKTGINTTYRQRTSMYFLGVRPSLSWSLTA